MFIFNCGHCNSSRFRKIQILTLKQKTPMKFVKTLGQNSHKPLKSFIDFKGAFIHLELQTIWNYQNNIQRNNLKKNILYFGSGQNKSREIQSSLKSKTIVCKQNYNALWAIKLISQISRFNKLKSVLEHLHRMYRIYYS